MAEGGKYSYTVQGSDECFENKCAPCAEEGDSQEALKYCPECKEHLCAICITHHQKVSATKKHTLYDTDFQHDEGEYLGSSTADDKMFKCRYHPDRYIEMYCGTHEMVYCSLCIAKKHRRCNGVLELEEAAEKIPINKEYDILRQIDCLKTGLQATRQKKINNLMSLDHERNMIIKTITNVEQLIIDKIKKLALNAKIQTSFIKSYLKKEIQEDVSVLTQAITDAIELRDGVATKKELDAKRQFALHILHKRIIANAQKRHDGVSKKVKKIKYFKNDEFMQLVSSADFLVQIV